MPQAASNRTRHWQAFPSRPDRDPSLPIPAHIIGSRAWVAKRGPKENLKGATDQIFRTFPLPSSSKEVRVHPNPPSVVPSDSEASIFPRKIECGESKLRARSAVCLPAPLSLTHIPSLIHFRTLTFFHRQKERFNGGSVAGLAVSCENLGRFHLIHFEADLEPDSQRLREGFAKIQRSIHVVV